jgi:hypothetical protein
MSFLTFCTRALLDPDMIHRIQALIDQSLSQNTLFKTNTKASPTPNDQMPTCPFSHYLFVSIAHLYYIIFLLFLIITIWYIYIF